MTTALTPSHAETSDRRETERMAAVHRYDVLDSPPDRAFDRITQLASRLFDVPVSLVSIVDTDRIWLKSKHGLDGVDAVPRAPGLCASVVLQSDPWVVTDAIGDPRTCENPLVTGDFGLRFYLGVPLRTHDGHNLGSLSVIDQKPRAVTEDEIATMSDLASVVVDELELRLAAHANIELQTALRQAAEETAASLQEALLPPSLPEVAGLRLAARYRAEQGRVGGDFYDVVPVEGGAALMIGDVCGKGPRAASFTATARWALRTILEDTSRPGRMLQRLNTVLTRSGSSDEHYCTLAVASLSRQADGIGIRTALGGHPPVLLVHTDGRVERLGSRGPIVGWEATVEYVDDAATAAPGDLVVLYTDGLLDAVCGRGAADTALVDLLRSCAGLPAGEVAAALDAAVRDGEPTDDVAFVVAEAVPGS